MRYIFFAKSAALILTLGQCQIACSDLARADDPLNYRPNCVYSPVAGPPGERFLVNDFQSTTAALIDDTCFGTGSSCLSKNGATACSETRPNTLSLRIAPFCSAEGNPPGKICVNYPADPAGGDYLSLAFDIGGTDRSVFSGYLEKLGDSAAGWFNLRALNYRVLTFRARAPAGSVVAEIALKSADGSQTTPKPTLEKYVANLGPDWQRVSVPIADLMVNAPDPTKCVDLERLGEFNVAFPRRWDVAADLQIPTCGVLELDDIAFER
jgi:hypothetical protein